MFDICGRTRGVYKNFVYGLSKSLLDKLYSLISQKTLYEFIYSVGGGLRWHVDPTLSVLLLKRDLIGRLAFIFELKLGTTGYNDGFPIVQFPFNGNCNAFRLSSRHIELLSIKLIINEKIKWLDSFRYRAQFTHVFFAVIIALVAPDGIVILLFILNTLFSTVIGTSRRSVLIMHWLCGPCPLQRREIQNNCLNRAVRIFYFRLWWFWECLLYSIWCSAGRFDTEHRL